MKKISLLFAFLIVGVLAACSNDGGQSEQDQEVPELIEVDLRLPEGQLEAGAAVVLEAAVTQGNEVVEDANEVKFEIREEGGTESEMLEAEHKGKGVYSAEKQFDSEGTYKITAHVTARDMHNMPSKELIVGNPAEQEHHEHHDDNSTSDSGDESHEHGHGHESTVTVDFQSGTELKINEKTNLSVSIQEAGKPLTQAEIRFEIWKEGREKHDFIEAAEAGEGVYEAERTFSESGRYQINVHVTKGSLHEHQMFTITVK
ncbi:FixH family protein [Mesobacillus foraminis]|uniref:FixH family protein n=1 Tax=Mesobacillus foraminis TaxID=279826 RepID=UPI001BED23C9|nr:FixH family protein [Mesobacillus foraminis]MBT2758671.1 FixH family protein [Mesobacillus foraminis]